jgi:hypothetical protein
MPGGNLIQLTSYGTQNVLLNGNPEFTYFYKIYKKYSHFATENVTIPLDGPNELFYDQEITVNAKIPRVTDLVKDMCLRITLPDIYSKYDPLRPYQYEFQWNRAVAAHLIKKISFTIGGSKIQEFDSEYIIARAHLDQDYDSLQKWRTLVGDVPELTDPARGVYAGGSQRIGYPSVVADTVSAQQLNRPSIFGTTLRVPLPFWFNNTSYNALPLIALQYHDCNVQITFRRMQELYTVLDPSGVRVRPGKRSNAFYGINEPEFVSENDSTVEIRHFLVDHGVTAPAINNLNIAAALEATYVSLTDEERKIFATVPMNYLITQVRRYTIDNLITRSLYNLELSNPVTRLIILARRSDAYEDRNQVLNYTNWWNYPQSPWSPTPGASPAINLGFSSGQLVTNAQEPIIREMRILLNGTEYQETKGPQYYTAYTQYTTCKGGSVSESRHMHVFPFSIMPPSTQPSGSVNASSIRLFEIDIDPYPLPINPTYVYNVVVYAESYNFLTMSMGMGGLKFA